MGIHLLAIERTPDRRDDDSMSIARAVVRTFPIVTSCQAMIIFISIADYPAVR